MLSGGADSVCLLDVAVRLGARVSALHVNYGLRDGAAEDEAFAGALCDGWSASRTSSAVGFRERGNLQARAARSATRSPSGTPPATTRPPTRPPTRPRRCSTGWRSRRARGLCSAWPPRRGRLVRPLLERDPRRDARAYCACAGSPGARIPPTRDRRFARARVRHELLADAALGGPAPSARSPRPRAQLRDEASARPRSRGRGARGARRRAGGGAGRAARTPARAARLCWRARGRAPAGVDGCASPRGCRTRRARPRAGRRGTRSLDLGGGLRAIAEYGTLRFSTRARPDVPGARDADRPGRVGFGDWEVEARRAAPARSWSRAEALGPARARCAAGARATACARVGLGGTKSLQDLFTDRKVPRELRRTLPVVEARRRDRRGWPAWRWASASRRPRALPAWA